MPIEEVVVDPGENITLASKLLIREEYWYKEICSIYPYGLNDNVRKVGNISKCIDKGIVVYTLFNKQKRKYRKRNVKRLRHKTDDNELRNRLEEELKSYKLPAFNNRIRTCIFGLQRRKRCV